MPAKGDHVREQRAARQRPCALEVIKMPSPPEHSERAFAFLKVNQRPGKPRSRGVTEIRGPYYTPLGQRYLQDILETMGAYVDALKFAGGSFALMPTQAVRELIERCHAHDGG